MGLIAALSAHVEDSLGIPLQYILHNYSAAIRRNPMSGVPDVQGDRGIDEFELAFPFLDERSEFCELVRATRLVDSLARGNDLVRSQVGGGAFQPSAASTPNRRTLRVSLRRYPSAANPVAAIRSRRHHLRHHEHNATESSTRWLISRRESQSPRLRVDVGEGVELCHCQQ